MKGIADSKSKEIEFKYFIISCFNKYATCNILSPKLGPNATIAPVQATFINIIIHKSQKKNLTRISHCHKPQ